MGDRILVEYEEAHEEHAPYATMQVQRSASGLPDLLFTSTQHVHGSQSETVTVIIKDADKVLTPALVWLQSRRTETGICTCEHTMQNAGGGYYEAIAEYDPACPVHSHHLYDPKKNEWVLDTVLQDREHRRAVAAQLVYRAMAFEEPRPTAERIVDIVLGAMQ
jgi:hypothetical protein